MKNDKILSISVATYNLGKMIEDNLNSFEKSKFLENIEVLIIDDGSTDETPKLVEKYVEKFPNTFKLIKQKNAGPGSTVNRGIENATGKYFKMVDGDDWVETENLDLLIPKLMKSEADMVITDFAIYDDSKKKIVKIEKSNVDECNEIDFANFCKDLTLNMYNVLFKTEILKNNVKLDNGFYTDVEYLLLPIPFIKKVDVYNICIYVYRVARAGQSMNIKSMQKHIDMHDLVLRRLIAFYENNKESMSEQYNSFIANRIACMVDVQLGILLSMYSKKEKNSEKIRKFISEIKDLSVDIYKIFANKIKAKVLLKSNYMFVPLLSKIYILKNS